MSWYVQMKIIDGSERIIWSMWIMLSWRRRVASQLQPIQVGYSIPVFYVSHTPIIHLFWYPILRTGQIRYLKSESRCIFFASESLFSYPYNYHISLSILCMYLFSLHLSGFLAIDSKSTCIQL
jgi:hypothetical protein